jgi:hypothetical protein
MGERPRVKQRILWDLEFGSGLPQKEAEKVEP